MAARSGAINTCHAAPNAAAESRRQMIAWARGEYW
jgi:hypothetical protein